ALFRERRRFPRGAAVAAGGALVVTACVMVLLHREQLTGSVALIQDANLAYLWLAAVAFLGSRLPSPGAWRTTLAGCGTLVGRLEASAPSGAGSLLNSFLPARLGDAARVTLFARTLPAGDGVLLVSAGAFAAIEVAHVAVQAMLVAVASAVYGLPLVPVAAAAGAAAGLIALAVLLRGRLERWRIRRLFEGADALLRDRRRGARVLGWQLTATSCRIAAAAAVAASVGV